MIAGAAAGAAQSLEEILAAQMFKAKLAEQQQQQAAQLALQTRQVEGMEADRAENRENQRQTVELNKRKFDADQQRGAYEDTARSNMSELVNDPTQLAAFSMASGVDVPRTVEGLMKKPDAPRTHVVSGNLVDDTGKVLFTAPKEQSGGGGPRTPHFVKMPDGSVKDINGVAPPGATPYDAVADRNAKKKETVHPQLLEYSKGVIRKIDDLIGRDDDPATPQNEARPNRITSATAGVGGQIRRMAPWNNSAKDVDAELFSLTSGLAISALQKMRASSETGGAVGNVALGEMEIMKNAEAAIRSDQSPANLRRQLTILRESEQRFLDALERDGRENDPGLNRGITAAPIPGAKDDIDALIDSLRGKPKG